jgi:4-diphosphocytidyl-2-C-methyl-D-erythritol kinase
MTAAPLTTRCRAKINLTLRVLGRRPDGYHELESLVAFAGVGDALSLEPGPETGLSLAGPFGAGLAAEPDNLVLKAARVLTEAAGSLRAGHFHLVKRLPLASGIGGGSADAAAALRLLARLNGINDSDPVLLRVAEKIGADVPVCLASRARVMAGLGEVLGPPLALPPLFAVLVNAGVAVATADVFRALAAPPLDPSWREQRSNMEGLRETQECFAALAAHANDLEAPARRLAPAIAGVLQRLASLPGCRLARMSGSGATCFALFDDCRASAAAAKILARAEPGWWVRPTLLR